MLTTVLSSLLIGTIRVLLLPFLLFCLCRKALFTVNRHSEQASARGQDHSALGLGPELVPASQVRQSAQLPRLYFALWSTRPGTHSLPSTLLYTVKFYVPFRSHHHPQTRGLREVLLLVCLPWFVCGTPVRWCCVPCGASNLTHGVRQWSVRVWVWGHCSIAGRRSSLQEWTGTSLTVSHKVTQGQDGLWGRDPRRTHPEPFSRRRRWGKSSFGMQPWCPAG